MATVAISATACVSPPDAIELTRPEGGTVTVALAEGERGLLLHFWATWCPSCVEELPLLELAATSCAQRNVRVLLVNVGESHDTVVAYAEELGLRLPVLRDPEGRAFRALSGRGLPLNAAWTPDGRSDAVGPRDASVWQAALEALGCGL